MKRYYVDKEAMVWYREYFDAENDEQAIELVKSDSADVTNAEWIDETTEYTDNIEIFSTDDYLNPIYSNL